MHRSLICSSHTISGVLPGGPVASRHGFRERVEACSGAGYRGMCLHFRDYTEQHAHGLEDRDLRAILGGNGISDLSIEFLTDWFVDGEAGALARANEATAFRAALAVGARSINVGSDLQGRHIPKEKLIADFRGLCERAATHGLAMALEIVAWSDVADVKTALDVIDGIDNAGLVIDAWHIFRGGVPLDDVVRIPGDRILSIQVNDGEAEPVLPLSADTLNRKLCGDGAFDLAGFIAALSRTGTTTPISVEIIAPGMAALDVREAARISFDTTVQALWARRLGPDALGRTPWERALVPR